jgi:hypothetical protein
MPALPPGWSDGYDDWSAAPESASAGRLEAAIFSHNSPITNAAIEWILSPTGRATLASKQQTGCRYTKMATTQ